MSSARVPAILILLCTAVGGQSAPPADPREAGVVCHVKVVSDKVEDVSSLDAWKKGVVKPGATEEEQVLAAWNTVVKFRHHDQHPREFNGLGDENAHDAIKLFNVYGYCSGTGAQPCLLQMARFLGFDARGWSINRWGVPEVRFGGGWHCVDPGTISYFRKADGTIASVEELVAGVKAWYAQNPGYLGQEDKIRKFQADPGWKKGPELLTRCPTMDPSGAFALNYFGWFTAMVIYDGSNQTPFLYEDGYSQGYEVNIQLRKGERLTRHWGNKGLHINMLEGGKPPECLDLRVGTKSLYYTPKLGDLAEGRIGNGTLEYDVPLGDGSFRAGALAAENLATRSEDGTGSTLHAKDPARPAVLILRMPSSYVYLGGEAALDAAVGAGGEITVECSDNHGLDWVEVARLDASGPRKIDLKSAIFRRYDYRLRLTLKGRGTGLERLKLTHDVQHSQRALPALGQGDNAVTFTAGPAEGTITIEPAGLRAKGKQVTFEDFKVRLEDAALKGAISATGPHPTVTIPVETPGDLVRLRFGAIYRARDAADAWDYQVSFDEGKTFKTVDRAAGPWSQNGKFITFSDVPPGTRKALVRFAGTQKNVIVLFRLRVDADFREPRGGFRPIRVTYAWEENGQPRQDVRVVNSPHETYSIRCAARPALKSIVLERAD